MAEPPIAERVRLVERGRRLQYFTTVWNSLEPLAALISGLFASSVVLVVSGNAIAAALIFGLWWADPLAGLAMVSIIC
jgi:hypothetical protein